MRKVSTIGERLRGLMLEQGMSYEQFGNLLDMRPQTLNRYVLGQREPKADAAMDMALRLGVNLYWLQGYDVPRRPDPEKPGDPRNPVVPILGTIRAGIPAIADQEIIGYAPADVPDPGQCFYLRVKGDSMIGAGIRENDLVLLRSSETVESGQIAACSVDTENATLKRVIIQKDYVILQPENPAYEPRILRPEDFDNGSARIRGVAIRLVRNL